MGAVGLHVQHRTPGNGLGRIHQGVEGRLIPLPADAEIGDALHKLHHIIFPPCPLCSDSLFQLSADGLCRLGQRVLLYQLLRPDHQRVHHHVLLDGGDHGPDAVVHGPGGGRQLVLIRSHRACAPANSSMASTFWLLSRIISAFRAAVVPMLT